MKRKIFAVVFLLGLFTLFIKTQKVFATGNIYYVSTSGNDTNSGTLTSPFKTFVKGVSVLSQGDTLYILSGTYNEQLNVTKNGTLVSPITISNYNNQTVVIDLQNSSSNNVSLTGSYVIVNGFEIKNSNGYCVNLQGAHNTLQNSIIHECHDHGVYTDGTYESILGNTVYHSTNVNSSLTQTSWGSGIKVRIGGDNILIKNNTVYNNYGEGIAITRGTNSVVTGNVSYDNYSVNIYIDNSYNILVNRNFVYNHTNNGFYKNAIPADNIALGEEFYSGWGAELSNITITNNLSMFGNHGVVFFGNDSGTSGGGVKNSTIAFNTFLNSINTEINLAYDTGQTDNLIANNIVGQASNKLIMLGNAAGITLSNNFWMNTLPPVYAQGTGDLTGDPRFATTPAYTPDTYRLGSTSPAIGKALYINTITDDYEGKTRSATTGLDVGGIAYSSYNSTPPPGSIPGDLNNDGKVDGVDYVIALLSLDLNKLNLVIQNIH
jgi:hypothetical protein